MTEVLVGLPFALLFLIICWWSGPHDEKGIVRFMFGFFGVLLGVACAFVVLVVAKGAGHYVMEFFRR